MNTRTARERRTVQTGGGLSQVLAAEQLPLFAPRIVNPTVPSSATLIDRFNAFHKANPHVYEEIRRRAHAEVRAGQKRISVKYIVESIRRDPSVQTVGEYKINNSFSAFYARLLSTEAWIRARVSASMPTLLKSAGKDEIRVPHSPSRDRSNGLALSDRPPAGLPPGSSGL